MAKKRRPLVLPDTPDREGSDDQSLDGDQSISTYDGSVSTLDGQLRALDKELFKMTKETDAILDSIRSEAKDESLMDDDDGEDEDDNYGFTDVKPKNSKKVKTPTKIAAPPPQEAAAPPLQVEKPKRKMNETRSTSFDDDDMDDELARLEIITNSIRESLDGKNSVPHFSPPSRAPQAVSTRAPAMPTPSPQAATKEGSSRKRNTKKKKAKKAPEVDKGASPVLWVSLAIVWSIVGLLAVHSKSCLMDEHGTLMPPFACFISSRG